MITTGGRFKYLQEALQGLRDKIDVLVIDDAGPYRSEIILICNKFGAYFIYKDKPRGLTDSWNTAFKYMVENNYDRCILSNDDVRFPKRFSHWLLHGTSAFAVVCPVSNQPTGNKNMFPKQWLFNYSSMAPSPRMKNRDRIQAFLISHYRKKPYEIIRYFNGFCFAFSLKNILSYMYDEENLFNPSNINTKNEIELGARIRHRDGKIVVCRTSYVFHYKGKTFKELKLRDKNHLWVDSPLFKERKI